VIMKGAVAALLLLAALALQAASLPVPRAPEPADSAVGSDYRFGPGRSWPSIHDLILMNREKFDFCDVPTAMGVGNSPYCAPTRACGPECDIIWNDMKIVATLADSIAYVDSVVQPEDPYSPKPSLSQSLCCGAQFRLRSYLEKECAYFQQDSNITGCSQLAFGKVALALASVAASPNGGEIPLPRYLPAGTYMDAALAINSRMDLLSKQTLAQFLYASSSTAAEVLASLRLAYVKKTAASWQGGSPEPPQGAASPAEAPHE